jgi:hypothetical protein
VGPEHEPSEVGSDLKGLRLVVPPCITPVALPKPHRRNQRRSLRIQRRSPALQTMFALDSRWHSPEMIRARQYVRQTHLSLHVYKVKRTSSPASLKSLEVASIEDYFLCRLVWAIYSYEIDHYWTTLVFGCDYLSDGVASMIHCQIQPVRIQHIQLLIVLSLYR